MLPTNVMSFMKKMVATESGTTAPDTGTTTDGGTAFGKLKQTLMTAQDKVVTKMSSPRPSLVPTPTPTTTTTTSSNEPESTTPEPVLSAPSKSEPGKPPSRAGACRVCLKAFKPNDFSRTCAECTHRVCEDCASYSKSEGGDGDKWTCSVCRRKLQSRAVLAQDSSESLLDIPLQELQRRHSEARLGSGAGGGGGLGLGGTGLAPPRSPELRRHSDVSPASLKELEKLKGSGSKTPEPDWGRRYSRATVSRQNSPPRTQSASRRQSRATVPRQHSYDEELKNAGGAISPSEPELMAAPASIPRRASAYDVYAAANRRGSSFRAVPDTEQRRRSSQLPMPGIGPRPIPALEDLEAAPKRQTSVDAEAIRIVIHDVDSTGLTADKTAAHRRVVLRKDPNDKTHRTRGFGMRVVGGKTAPDGRLFAYIVWTVPGGQAEKGGLQQGDKVLEWGGVSLVDRTFEEACAIMDRTLNNDVLELVIEHATDLRMCDLLDDPQQTAPPSQPPSRKGSDVNLTIEGEAEKTTTPASSPTRRKLPKTPEQLQKERTVSGRIQIQVWYHDEKRELVVAILAADDLASRDDTLGYGNQPEAYARLCLLPLTMEEHCMQTEVAPPAQNPIWNANLAFPQVPSDEIMERFLEITLWDLIPHNEHAFLGECTIDLQKTFLDDRAVWCRLEDPRQLRSRSPHMPRKRSDFMIQRSTSDDLDSIGECASLLHPDHAWGGSSRRGSSQSEQLEVEVYQLGRDFSRSLPGSRRSSYQSIHEQPEPELPPQMFYTRNERRRSSCTRVLRDSDEILRSLRAVKGELGRTMSLTEQQRKRSVTVVNNSNDEDDDVEGRTSPPRLGPGQIKPIKYRFASTRPVELKLGLLMTKGQLEVEVVCARHLPRPHNDTCSPPDTYVKCYLRDNDKWLQKKKTRIIRHTYEPYFRQTIRYQACDVLGRNLVIMLWEKQSGFEHNLGLGGVEVALDTLTLTRLTIGWYPLVPIETLAPDIESP